MRKNKIIISLFFMLTIFVLITPNKINAETEELKYASSNQTTDLTGGSPIFNPIFSNNTVKNTKYDYTIEKYNINMMVNENNTFDIIETITTNFNVSKHGIFRKIPLKNEVIRLDNSKTKNTAQITNIDVVGENYKTYNESGYKVIKIGDANRTFTGSYTYIIKYTYNIGKDPLKNIDELYFNLIGEEWDAPISNISFNIKMPKEFDKSLLGFSSRAVGSTYNSNISYTVNGNTISGKVNGTLNEGEALTVRLELPEGYFVGAGHKIDKFSAFVIVLCVIFVLIAYKIWEKYGKDDQVIETVEFYPPEGYNSAEIGYLYSGIAEDEAVISLLIYLANKEYLKIEETGEHKKYYKGIDIDSDEKIMKIIKLKEYDGDNDNEREFFNGLFAMSGNILEKADNIQIQEKLKGNEISWEEAKKRAKEDRRTYVTTLELISNLYSTVSNIKENIKKEYKDKIIDRPTKGKRKWLVFMMIIIFLLITVKPMYEFFESGLIIILPVTIIFSGIAFVIMMLVILSKIRKIVKFILLICSVGFAGEVWAFFLLPSLSQNLIYLITYFLGIISMFGIGICWGNMSKRTEFGNEILGKLKGFKRFLEIAEKEQLESLVMKEPEYFYNILPYTYALGVSDKWIEQFESIAIEPPSWYNSKERFDFNNFSKSMDSTMSSIERASSSSSGGSSGGSSSGGGSSGGGSGGGGGGSW